MPLRIIENRRGERKTPNPRVVGKLIWFPIRGCNDRAGRREGRERKFDGTGWGTKKRGIERKKTLSKTGPGVVAHLRSAHEREDFPIIYVFSPPRFFALQQIKRNPHPWGTLLDYSLFSSCFHSSPFAFRPVLARARARGYAWQIAFLSLCATLSFLEKKKIFFSSTLAKFRVVTLRSWRMFDWRCRDCSFVHRKYHYRILEAKYYFIILFLHL